MNNGTTYVEPSLEMILFCVRKLLDKKSFVRSANMTYCPSNSVFDDSIYGTDYSKYIVTTQRVVLEPMASPQTALVLYLFYRNKKTQYQGDPVLSSCEMGIFYKGLFYALKKIHIDPANVSGFVDDIIASVGSIQNTIDTVVHGFMNGIYQPVNSVQHMPNGIQTAALSTPMVTPTLLVELMQQELIKHAGLQIII